MSVPARRRRFPLLEAEHLYSMTDDRYQYELVAGRLVVMEPPGFEHAGVVSDITVLLVTFVRTHALGRVVCGDPGFVLVRSPDTVRGPDVAFLRADRIPSGDDAWRYFEGAPDLAVEVLSPNDRPGEVGKKVGNYLAAGTRLVWVVDPRKRTVVVHAPDAIPRTLTDADDVDGGDVLPGFREPAAAFFGPVAP